MRLSTNSARVSQYDIESVLREFANGIRDRTPTGFLTLEVGLPSHVFCALMYEISPHCRVAAVAGLRDRECLMNTPAGRVLIHETRGDRHERARASAFGREVAA